MKISEKAKKIIRRVFRITLTTVLVILGIILLILVLIQTGPVQNYGRGDGFSGIYFNIREAF